MNKLSLDALKERVEAVASAELLNSISGGTENACHDQEGGTSDEQDDWMAAHEREMVHQMVMKALRDHFGQ